MPEYNPAAFPKPYMALRPSGVVGATPVRGGKPAVAGAAFARVTGVTPYGFETQIFSGYEHSFTTVPLKK
ncbi:MAG: hypothetical protein AVDCRST_MAG56-6215 [uncultured Cytophagales bacterium]|uniref:Uncharacterized protein n=1 Tax=uncultured Cytophagales bacterium TaxID=158755 RepID=A0A6J4KNH4_9SPHI|nr:MAG: hypothetical protein AVDCRST_MAG56-6215 [uncultured Cytophagales bacterium]